jgi:hypothetical protein
MGLIPTATANWLMVVRGWRNKVCIMRSRVLFIIWSITVSLLFVNNLDNYHNNPGKEIAAGKRKRINILEKYDKY